MTGNRWPLAALGGLVTLLIPAVAGAADDSWVRYENQHFLAYSNAPGKRVLVLLGDLETFRAAFIQVGNVVVPTDAPKTTVLIPASKKEFQSLSTSKLQAGFAWYDGKSTLIVMPAQGEKGLTRTVIRHEYGHALLRFKKFNYPAWYEEGFAELVSSTELVNKGQSFTFGSLPERAQKNGPPLYDWDELVSAEFNPHAITNLRVGSSAYAQAWLLAHYATLGNNLKNATTLQNYFDKLKDGESLRSAFKGAFGASASQLWNTQLKDYAARLPYYTFAYKAGEVDLVFATAPPAVGEVDGILRYLQILAAAFREPQPPNDVLASLPGRWAPLVIGMPCEDYVDLTVATPTSTLTITPPKQRTGRSEDPARYRYEVSDDGTVRIEPMDREGVEDDETSSRSLKHRTTDVLCIGPNSTTAAQCSRMLHRCGA